MVRAIPDKKAHSDRKKGTEPKDNKNKVKHKTVDNDSPSARKKYFKELPGGVLPKHRNPKSDNVNENDGAKVLLELEKRIQQSHPRELTLRCRPHPERRTYGIKSPPNAPPTGGRDTDSPYGNYLRGMCVGMILFSIFMTFLVSWSPGMTLAWVAILTISLLSLTECRTQARNFFTQTSLQLVTLAYRKLTSVDPPDIQGGGGNRGMILHPLNA
jgi:hypothetical protein